MNFKNMTIGKRITLGYAFIIALLVVLAATSYTGVGGIVSNAAEVIDGNKLNGLLTQREVDHLNWVAQVNSLLTDDSITTLTVEMDDHQCGLGKWLYSDERLEAEGLVPSLAPLLKKIEEPHYRLHNSAIEIKEVFRQADVSLPLRLTEIEAAHLAWAGRIRDGLIAGNASLNNVQTDPGKCVLGTFLTSPEGRRAYEAGDGDFKRVWGGIPASHNRMHQSASRIKEALASGDSGSAKLIFQEETRPMLAATVKSLRDLSTVAGHELKGMQQANQIYAQQTMPALHEVQDLLHQVSAEAKSNIMTDGAMLQAASSTRLKVSVLALFIIAAAVLIAFFTATRLITLLSGIVSQLGQGSSEVNSASGQIAAASHSLAEGASEQAATLEETSSALEEVSSLTRQNADNTGQADILMTETREAIGTADHSMQELSRSMAEISQASSETQRIVKTIDEIAFQTNLLALNAAVEAARAGEAGAGFAVVADEVRNLALRAAQSAKETSGLIDSTVEKVDQGAELLVATGEDFSRAAQSSERMSTLVSEITTASAEQAQGIDQVNRAVNEIDSVTQLNAAAAEQSASAAEELTGQAAAMQDIVANLQAMVGGRVGAEAAKASPVQTAVGSAAPQLQLSEK